MNNFFTLLMHLQNLWTARVVVQDAKEIFFKKQKALPCGQKKRTYIMYSTKIKKIKKQQTKTQNTEV